MARFLTQTAVTALALAWLSAPAAAQSPVTLSFSDGRVTVVVKNAPLSAVLAEWQRQGGTRFINSERLPASPITLELTAVPERHALAVLLRPFSGYMASSRTAGDLDASMLGVVVVMPTLARASPPPSQTNAASPRQPSNQPRPMGRGGFGRPGIQIGVDLDADPTEPDPDDDLQSDLDSLPPGMRGGGLPGMPTAPPADPSGDPAASPQEGRPAGFPGALGTTTIPGMIVPATPVPGAVPPKPPKPPGHPNTPAPQP